MSLLVLWARQKGLEAGEQYPIEEAKVSWGKSRADP